MKTVIIFAVTFLINIAAQAQDSWMVKHNTKTVLAATGEDAEKNTITLSAKDLRGKGTWTLTINQKEKKAGWVREISVTNFKETEIEHGKGFTYSITNGKLLALLKKNNKLSIYTTYVPTDPNVKATIRIRRIHLVTVVLE